MTRIDHDYVLPVDPEKLVYGAMRGLVGELDQHSRIYQPVEWEGFQQETQGELTGIGVDVLAIDDVLVVACVVPDGPAARAGLLAGERLVEIAGKVVDVRTRH